MTRIRDLGELGFLRWLRAGDRPARGVEIGIGDDCAVVRIGERRVLLTTDALVEDVHFRRGWDSAGGLGRRLWAV
ncbi:MAG: AIR synthase related protein, partial [Candidatus Binatia bacterium]